MTTDLRYLLCYRYLPLWESADREQVWQFVYRHGGHVEQLLDTVDFYIPDQYASLLLLSFPGLQHIPALDYIV